VANLLLIDDDLALIPEQLRQVFPAPDNHVDIAANGGDGLTRIRRNPPDVVLLDLHLPDQSGLRVDQLIRELDPRLPVIFITVARTADAAIEAMKGGAFDYLHKPLDARRLREVVTEAIKIVRLRTPVALNELPAEDPMGAAMLGGCTAMLDVYKAVGRVAAKDVTVLVTGESGTGKELVARAIVQHSARRDRPFLALNCAAIPESLLESELFGYEKGAFTGADRRRIGKFEQCSGGTILLDEIGDMPISLQAKILRFLQERTFERVGGNETIISDVRVIAATHRDLKARVADGSFRPDLYYRLSVFTIHLPPLRERANDLTALTRHYLRRFSRELEKEVVDISPEALARLGAYNWPGNVRELQSVIKQALLLSSGTVLIPAFLPELADDHPSEGSQISARPLAGATPLPIDIDAFIRAQLVSGSGDVYATVHREVDRRLLARALEFTGGNHREAARLLGISRQTMRVRMRSLGLRVAHLVEDDDGPS